MNKHNTPEVTDKKCPFLALWYLTVTGQKTATCFQCLQVVISRALQRRLLSHKKYNTCTCHACLTDVDMDNTLTIFLYM